MSHTIHTFQKETCTSCRCVNPPKGFMTEGQINPNYNVYKGQTSRSCIFYTPTTFTNHYDLSGSFPYIQTPANQGNFYTNQMHPSSNDLLVSPADLTKASLFLGTSLLITDHDGNTKEHINEPILIPVERPGASTTLPNKITDTLIYTFTDAMFGSFDTILSTFFNKSPYKFLTLTNPNELALGSPNRVQIIWPDGIDWQLSFISPSEHPDPTDPLYNTSNDDKYAVKYTYSSDGNVYSQSVDINGEPISDTVVRSVNGCKTFAVFDNPTGYITNRQPFDMTKSISPSMCNGMTGGITGGSLIVSGEACLYCITVDNYTININSKCLCIPLELTDGITGIPGNTTNGINLVALLNAAFNKYEMKGWQAIIDAYYPYFRIVHPDNVLKFSIKLKKFFYEAGGYRNDCYTEIQIYKQGALTEFIKTDSMGNPVTTTNVTDIMDGLSWSIPSDKNGCFTIS